jgi:hypothetical protein
MSARELRYHARNRGLTGSYWEGRGNRRTALIDFLESGSLDNLPGCHVRSELSPRQRGRGRNTYTTIAEPVLDPEPPVLAQVSSYRMMPWSVLAGFRECFRLSVAPPLFQFHFFYNNVYLIDHRSFRRLKSHFACHHPRG